MTHDTDYRHPDARYLQSEGNSMKGIGIALAVLAAIVAAVLYFGGTSTQTTAPAPGTAAEQTAPAAPPAAEPETPAPAPAPAPVPPAQPPAN